jgi:UDP-glucose 4-epimerase
MAAAENGCLRRADYRREGCIRHYIHVCDLVAAHSDALAYLRDGGA